MSKIGLVLSGGMAKGAYQAGALRAIGEIFSPSDFLVSSASVGALNSYAFCTYGLDKWFSVWDTLDSNNQRKWITKMIKSGYLQTIIEELTSNGISIENTFYIPLVNIKKRKLVYVDIAKMSPAEAEAYLRASVAVPVFNSGVQINGEFFYDGALIDNIPIAPIFKHDVDYTICIYFDNYNYTFENENLDNKIIKINFSDNKIISSSICFSKASIDYMTSEGYTKAKKIIQYVFADGTDKLSVVPRIEALNSTETSKSLRITGDIIVNNMNKIAKKFFHKVETAVAE